MLNFLLKDLLLLKFILKRVDNKTKYRGRFFASYVKSSMVPRAIYSLDETITEKLK